MTQLLYFIYCYGMNCRQLSHNFKRVGAVRMSEKVMGSNLCDLRET